MIQREAGEIAVLVELGAVDVPLDAHPVVEGLERKVDVLGGFQFEHRQAAGSVGCEEIKHAAIHRGEGRDLAVEGRGKELCVEFLDLRADLRFEPGFGIREVEWVQVVDRGWRAEFGKVLGECDDFGEVAGAGGAFSMDSEHQLASGGAREFQAVYP